MSLTSAGAVATLAQWQATLRSVTYADTAVSRNTATSSITLSVIDGSPSSATVTTPVGVVKSSQAIAFAALGSETVGDPNFTLSDAWNHVKLSTAGCSFGDNGGDGFVLGFAFGRHGWLRFCSR
jgi:hypothetical protein